MGLFNKDKNEGKPEKQGKIDLVAEPADGADIVDSPAVTSAAEAAETAADAISAADVPADKSASIADGAGLKDMLQDKSVATGMTQDAPGEEDEADVDEIMRKYDRESNTRIWDGVPKIVESIIMVARFRAALACLAPFEMTVSVSR